MTFDDIFYGLWFLLPLVSFLSMPLFILILWLNGKRAANIFLLIMALESVLAALYSVHTFGGAFGPGMMIFCLSFVVFLISLILFIFIHSRFYQSFIEDEERKKNYIRGGLLILLMQFSPVIGYFVIRVSCSIQTHRNAQPIIQDINTYYQESGKYPDTLQDVNILDEEIFPLPGCSWLEWDTGYPNKYEIVQCSSGETLLTAESIDGSSILRYNFYNGAWSSVSFLDGACSTLR